MDRCAGCGFLPASIVERAQSMTLSPEFDVGEHTFGLPEAELKRAAALLGSGQPYPYDPATLATLERELQAFLATTPGSLAWSLLKWLFPVVVASGVVWYLLAHAGRR